jgi:CIC family chloride channel protein
MGGLLLGIILVFIPQVMGVGYESVDQALNGRLLLGGLVILGAAKLVATIISYASGNAGGIFAPTLFLGAMVGGAMGMLVQRSGLLGGTVGDPGAYALVGMGTLFAGIIRAPMTSVFMIFEVTQDYAIVVPLMIANLTSFIISRRYQEVPIYHALLRQEGIHLPSPATRAAVGRWRVREMMEREPHTLPVETTIAAAWQRAQQSANYCFPVLNGERLVGLVSRKMLEEALSQGRGDHPLAELSLHEFAHVHPDQPLELALERLAQTPGLLPVVSRSDVTRLEGVIDLEGLLKTFAYSRRL